MEARLFFGCPVPKSVAAELHEWASETLDTDSLRLVPPENYHVTLVFYGQVDAERQAVLEELTHRVEWEPVQAISDKVKLYGRSAIGVSLKTPPGELLRLDRRLNRLAMRRHNADLRNRRAPNLHITIARMRKP
ncbi:MAG: 2'-5' RNA ligase family protein [Fimbriimonadales bacterium]